MKIEEMADVFLNSANFAKHIFLTLAPPSGYALNLKALIKVSKVSWTSQLSYEILRSSFERKFNKTNFISPKRTPPKSPASFSVKILIQLETYLAAQASTGQPHNTVNIVFLSYSFTKFQINFLSMNLKYRWNWSSSLFLDCVIFASRSHFNLFGN